MEPADKANLILSSAVQAQAKFHQARKLCRETYRKNEPNHENLLRINFDGLLFLLIQEQSDVIEITSPNISYQISLLISFVRTHYLVFDMIMNGDLIEAATLVRKQLEKLTRLHELETKNVLQLERKTPNVINTLKEFGKRLYPELSLIAHSGSPDVFNLLGYRSEGDRSGPVLLPHYVKESHKIFELYIPIALYFVGWLIPFLKKSYPSKDVFEYEKTFLTIFDLAKENGIIEVEE